MPPLQSSPRAPCCKQEFPPSRRPLPACRNPLLDHSHRSNTSIIGSNRDFAEFTPFRSTTLFRLIDGELADTIIPMRAMPIVQAPIGFSSREYWEAVWSGAARDAVAETTIITTAAAALMSLRKHGATSFDVFCEEVTILWDVRVKRPS